MKTHILSLLIVLCLSGGIMVDALAQSSTYRLTTQSDPQGAGSCYSYPSEPAVGDWAYIDTSPNTGWDFVGWYLGDSLISVDSFHGFTMPAHDLDFVAHYEYNPSDPPNPGDAQPRYLLKVVSFPEGAGSSNYGDGTRIEAGLEVELAAYPSTNWHFVGWYLGDSLLNTESYFYYEMPAHPVQLVARYEYEPSNPSNPGANYWNPETGEIIVDDFEKGSLYSAIDRLVSWDERDQVQQLTVVGECNYYDMNIFTSYKNLMVVDLSRTFGYDEMSSYAFSGMSQLSQVILPSCLTRLSYNVFSDCSSLQSITCHALTPPTTYYTFDGMPEGVILYVPATAVAQYSEAPGWKDFSAILAIKEQVCQMEVLLPEGVTDGLYLELINRASGQRQRYLLSAGRQVYTFYGLLHQTAYDLYITNRNGAILARQENVEVAEEDVTVTISSLLPVCGAELMVVSPEGTDVTAQTHISWTTTGAQYLGQGATLAGNVEGDTLIAQVSLPQSLVVSYQAPAAYTYVVATEHPTRVLILDRYPMVSLTGLITDVTDDHVLSGVNVLISQTFADRYTQSQTLQSAADGRFALAQMADVPTEITFSANGYLNRSYTYSEGLGGNLALEDVSLRPITGAVVALDVTYQYSAVAGEDTHEVPLTDASNLSYIIYNETKQQSINSFSVQYPNLVLLEEVSEGDVLRVTLSSRTDLFDPVTTTGTVDARNRINVACHVIQRGAIRADYEDCAANKVSGSLYDAQGRLLSRSSYTNRTFLVEGLATGTYTLITMSESAFFNGVYNLSQLQQSGLNEGIDYTMNSLQVTNGVIATVSNEQIPVLDESRFYYTSSETRFTANKPEITAGNYVTLTGLVDFKSEYASRVSNVSLVIDLPIGCSYVANSLMIGNQIANLYDLDEQTLTVPMSDLNKRVRFCAISTLAGTCRPSASVRFDLDGETHLQPIGSALFNVTSLSLLAPERTATKVVSVSGIALPESRVDLYDGQMLIGSTRSIKSGRWSLQSELDRPYDYTYHQLHAHVTSPEGLEFDTESRSVLMDSKSFDVVKINTLVNGQKLSIIPGQEDGSTQTYSFNPSLPSFTFEAETNTVNSDEVVSAMYFNVTTNDGNATIIPASYSKSKGTWVASADFSTSALPVNVTTVFYQKPVVPAFDPAYIDLCSQAFADIDLHVLEVASQQEESPYLIRIDTLSNTSEELIRQWTCYSRQGETSFEMKQRGSMRSISQSQLVAAQLIGIAFQIESKSYYAVFVNEEAEFGVQVYDAAQMQCAEYLFYDFSVIPGLDGVMRKPAGQQSIVGYVAAGVGAVAGVAGLIVSAPAWAIGLGVVGLGAAVVGTIDWINDTNNLKKKINENAPCLRDHGQYDNILSDYNKATGAAAFSNVFGTAAAKNGLLIAYAAPTAQFAGRAFGVAGLLFTATGVGSGLAMDGVDRSIDDLCNPEPEPDPNNPKWKPSIDPSGYVYEAVSSNRLQGVTATAYYKETLEDMYGDPYEEIVLWDAEEFAQKNPLFTDENGMYAWDVPTGLWQVKFEKTGYETTYSDWLPVPPPQLEVNIPMTQYLPAEVVAVNAYETGIELTFDKYMQPEMLSPEYICVVQNDQVIEGSIQLLDEEIAYVDGDPTYARQLRFVPVTPLAADSEVQLTVNRKVQTYAGIPMSDDFVQTFTVQREVHGIQANETITLTSDSLCEVTIQLLPAEAAAGHLVTISSSTEEIVSVNADTIKADAQGYASFTLQGQLPGTATITYSVVGTNVFAQSEVQVLQLLPTAVEEVISEWNETPGYIAIYNQSGILMQRCEDLQAARCLQLSDLPQGIYLLTFVTADHVTSKRVLKR